SCPEAVAHELKNTLFSRVKTRDRKEFPAPVSRDERVLELLESPELSEQAQLATLRSLTEIPTRHSYSREVHYAEAYIKDELKSLPRLTVEAHKIRFDMSNNVVARLQGTNDSLSPVVIGTHYDCQNHNVWDKTGRAPGANENGTGVAVNLALAAALARSSHRLERTVEFHFYTGEEQGYFGSRALAKYYKEQGKDIHAFIGLDGFGYTADKYGEIKLGFFPYAYADSLVDFVVNAVDLYIPGLTVDSTPECNTANAAWHENDYDAIGLHGSTESCHAYPWRHNVEDTIDKLHLFQLEVLAQAVLACTAELAGVSS
ncbi:MAG: hypothetical protein MHM6MM_007838, partial [Cercozoa sp. M6MM]